MTNTTIDYYYNGEWQVVEERRAVGAGSAQVHIQYLWCPSYIDTPVLRWRDTSDVPNQTLNETLYYTVDANKNVTALITPNGQVVERYLYDPYGRVTVLDNDWNEIAWSASRKNEILFAGYRYNPETGYYQVRHREFNPLIGRWIQRDPLGYVDGGNLYEYVRSRPLLLVDPHGLLSRSPDCGQSSFRMAPNVNFPSKLLPRNRRNTIGLGFLSASLTLEFEPLNISVCSRCCPAGTRRAGERVDDFHAGIGIVYRLEFAAATWGGGIEFGSYKVTVWAGLRVSGGAYGRVQVAIRSDRCDDVPWEFVACFDVRPYGEVAVGGELIIEPNRWLRLRAGLTGHARIRANFEICYRCREGQDCELTRFRRRGLFIDGYIRGCFPYVGRIRSGITWRWQ